MKKRILSCVMSLVLLLGMLPNTGVSAMAEGSPDVPQIIDLSTVRADGDGYTYETSYGSKVITITEGGFYTLNQSDGGTVTANVIVEPTTEDQEVTLILNGVNIRAGGHRQTSRYDQGMQTGTAAISVQGNAICNLILADGTTNTLNGYNGGANTLFRTAAISVENTYHNGVARLSTLKISGSGNLNATGVEQAAAIGGNCNRLTGNIMIEGGNILAIGGAWGAAIGDGDTMGNTDIRKWNCADTAVGGVVRNCQPATIHISGGTVTAIAQAGTPAIGSSDQLSGESAAVRGKEWDGLRIQLSGGTITAVGSPYHGYAQTPTTAIGAGSGTTLNPANIVISKSDELTLLALSRLSSKIGEGAYPISHSGSADIPAISGESTATVLNILMTKTTDVPASSVDLRERTERLLTPEEQAASQEAITKLEGMLAAIAGNYRVCGVAVVLPVGEGGIIVDGPDGTYYPPRVTKPDDVELLEQSEAATFSVTVSKDPQHSGTGEISYTFRWQVSPDGGLNWSDVDVTTGSEYSVTTSNGGKTSTLTLAKDGVLLTKNLNQYRCTVKATVGQNTLTTTSGAATLYVYNYYTTTVKILAGDEPVSLSTVTGDTDQKLYISRTPDKPGGLRFYQELTEDPSQTGVYSSTVRNGEYDVYSSSDETNFTPFHGLKFIISDADAERTAQYYSVTYNPGVDEEGKPIVAEQTHETKYYYAGTNVTFAGAYSYNGYDFTGLKDENEPDKVYQPGETLENIRRNYALVAQWKQQYTLSGTIRLDAVEQNNFDQDHPHEVTIQLIGRPEDDTALVLQPIAGFDPQTVTLQPDSDGDRTHTGMYSFENLPHGWHYAIEIIDAHANYKTTYTYNHEDMVHQKCDAKMIYDPAYFVLRFDVDASAVAGTIRPKGVSVQVMQKNGSEWIPVTSFDGTGEEVTSVIPVLLDTDGTGTGSLSVQGYQNGTEAENPYEYRIEVVHYLMPDGTTVTLKADAPYYSDAILIGGNPAADDAGVQFTADGDTAVQSAGLTAKITAASYTVAYETNQAGMTEEAAENVIAIPAMLPQLTKTGYVFLGWYYDDGTFQDRAEPGKYITASMDEDNDDTITLYAKWAEPLSVEGSVYISWLHDGHPINLAERTEKAEVILQRTLQDANDGWNAVTAQTVSFDNANIFETTSENKAFTFENIEAVNENGRPYQFRIVVNQLDYTSRYHNEAFTNETAAGTGTESPAPGSYHVQLTFSPELHILPYQVDASLLAKAVRPEKLEAKLVYRTDNVPGEDTDLNKWPNEIVQHENVNLSIPLSGSDSGIAGDDSDSKANLWVYQKDGSPFYFQIKLVNADGSPFEPVGYSLAYGIAAFYDRNMNRWAGGTEYQAGGDAKGTKAVSVTLVPNPYPVSFNLGYDAYPEAMDPQIWKDSGLTTYTYGVGASALPTPPAREHHRFDGWFASEECTGSPVTGIAYHDTGAKVFYAKWTRISDDAVLSYAANGGKNPPAAETVTVPIGGSVTKELAGAGNMTHSPIGGSAVLFLGWTAEATAQIYEAGDTAPAVITSITMTDDSNVYAAWGYDRNGNGTPDVQEQTVTITYEDGAGGSVFASRSFRVLPGTATPVFGEDPLRKGYSFLGWTPIVAEIATQNQTYTAAWRQNGGSGGTVTTYYTLRYDSNGGTEYQNESYARDTVVELKKAPSREGYTFAGWYADKELTRKITEIKMTSNQTVYADWRASTVPGLLNGDDHFAYVVGYPDGRVGPKDSITRAETATIFFRLLKDEVRDGNLTHTSSFADVGSGTWYNTSVCTMERLGILKGRTATSFAPTAPITRAEFAAICARFDTGLSDGKSNFNDIGGHWAKSEIERAAALGWVQGDPDGKFRPDSCITRAEAMTMINRVLCRIPEAESDLLSGMNVWPDSQPGTWYYLAVQEATNSHDFERKSDVYERWTELTADPDWKKYE